MSLHSSSSVNGEGSTPKDPLYKILDESRSLKLWKERTSNIKCFKCLGRGHIASQCPTKKIMIIRGQDIYSSQEETTSCLSSSGSEDEVRGEKSSEEVYPHEEGDLLTFLSFSKIKRSFTGPMP
ncbi:hypothetical protein HKD37_10G027915 [Glycine soja]